jgi:hypothetical protein
MVSNGISKETYRKLMIDGFSVYSGFTNESSPGTFVGALRGGSTFNVETELHTMAVDGAKGDVMGDKRIIKVTAFAECNFVEISPDLIMLAMPGVTTTEEPAGTPTHEVIKRALQISLENYTDTIAFIGKLSDSAHNTILILNNVLSTGNFSIDGKEGDEAVLKVKFTGHFDPDDLDAEPWEIQYPLDVLTTEGA